MLDHWLRHPFIGDSCVGITCEDRKVRHNKGTTGTSMGGSVVRVKGAEKPPRADVTCPVCKEPKRYPCKRYDEKKRKMVALPKIHAEREALQKQWLADRRERLADKPQSPQGWHSVDPE